jgi:Ser/Thr protein kinase RdoA (MazF antagonist)
MTSATPYADLTPDVVLDAVDSLGHVTDGRILALNSYENRVYQLGLEDGSFVVTKFYRPDRWSDAAILEEHAFALELCEHEIPVVAPLVAGDGETLHEHEGFRFAVFPRQGGRWPELSRSEEREWMGRFLGRIHAVGERAPFEHRRALSTGWLGHDAVGAILDSDWLPEHLTESYQVVTEQLLARIEQQLEDLGEIRTSRIHGDCHPGNVLWTEWLFLSGSREESAAQLMDLLEGYGQFCDFDYRELRLIEALRGLRMLHHTAWIARRWLDPAFPKAFPWFETNKYWAEHVLALKEQLAALEEPVLEVY